MPISMLKWMKRRNRMLLQQYNHLSVCNTKASPQLMEEIDLPVGLQLHGQVEERSVKKDEATINMKKNDEIIQSYITHTSEYEMPVDSLYDQVDKIKKNEKTTQLEYDIPVDVQYDQVNESKMMNEVFIQPHTDTDVPVDQLYAQVDKIKVCEVSPEESGAVYSIVNKPSPNYSWMSSTNIHVCI